MLRRGQVTIFILMAAVVLVLFSVYQMSLNSQKVETPVTNPALSAISESCLANAARYTVEGMYFGTQVDHFMIEDSQAIRFVPLLYDGKDNMPLDTFTDMNGLVKTYMTQCLQNAYVLSSVQVISIGETKTQVIAAQNGTMFATETVFKTGSMGKESIETIKSAQLSPFRAFEMDQIARNIIDHFRNGERSVPLGYLIDASIASGFEITYRYVNQIEADGILLSFKILDKTNNIRTDFGVRVR